MLNILKKKNKKKNDITVLKGVPVCYYDFPLIDMKYHAFEDDVNIYMRDADDCRTVARELHLFRGAAKA